MTKYPFITRVSYIVTISLSRNKYLINRHFKVFVYIFIINQTENKLYTNFKNVTFVDFKHLQ